MYKAFLTTLGSLLCCSHLFSAELEHLWSIEQTFNMPESAAYDPTRNVIYVSNVNHYAKDNNGFISRVSADGKSVDLTWLTGLHSPTGLAVQADRLYAVDFDALVIIDLSDEKIIARVPAIDADANPSLNDVVVSAAGDVYVSGSRSRSIYKLIDNHLEIWLQDPQRLKSANGLWVYEHLLLHGGENWTAYDIESRHVVKDMSVMGRGLRDIDGITGNGQGTFFLTLIDDPRIWLRQKGSAPKPLSEDKVNGIDLHFDSKTNVLFVPRVPNSLSAYRVVFD